MRQLKLLHSARLGAGLACLLFLGGCATGPGPVTGGNALSNEASYSRETNGSNGPKQYSSAVEGRSGGRMGSGDRRIEPFDIIIIEVFGEDELSVERRVEARGYISFPLLERVSVAGKTASEVALDLQERLGSDYLRHPQVSVLVKEYVQRTVNVFGPVVKQGNFDLPGEQSWGILDAIAEAGGLTKEAKRTGIELNRQGKTYRFSLDELKKVTDPGKKFLLEPGDVIIVKERFF
jgi:protein involved in polysaccharide export with SLBB domain